MLRPYAQASSHFPHDVLWGPLRCTTDQAQDVVGDQEVLAELAVGADGGAAQATEARLPRLVSHRLNAVATRPPRSRARHPRRVRRHPHQPSTLAAFVVTLTNRAPSPRSPPRFARAPRMRLRAAPRGSGRCGPR